MATRVTTEFVESLETFPATGRVTTELAESLVRYAGTGRVTTQFAEALVTFPPPVSPTMGQTFTGQLFLGTATTDSSLRSGNALPLSGNVGDLFLLNTTGILYSWTGAAWVSTRNANQLQGEDISATVPTNGQVLKYDSGAGEWAPATDSAAPAGADTEIQFNNSNAFGASANLTWNGTVLSVNTGSGVDIGSGAVVSVGALDVDAAAALTLGTSTATSVQVGSATAAVNISGAFALPTTDGIANQVLATDGLGAVTWVAPSGTPAGADTQVQFNSGGSAFGASADFTYNTGSSTLTLTSSGTALSMTDGARTVAINPSTTTISSSETLTITAVNDVSLTAPGATLVLGDGTTSVDVAGSEFLVDGNAGSINEVLTSAGSGALPTWQAAGNVSSNLTIFDLTVADVGPLAQTLTLYPAFNCTVAGTFTLVAPDPVPAAGRARQVTFINTAAGTVTIVGAGSIQRTMSEGGGSTWVYSGSGWYCTSNV